MQSTNTTSARMLRECTVCGEKVPMSHATEAWEARHSHTSPDSLTEYALTSDLRNDPLVIDLLAALAAERDRADRAEAKLAALKPLFAVGYIGSGFIDDASRDELVNVCNRSVDRSDKVRMILGIEATA